MRWSTCPARPALPHTPQSCNTTVYLRGVAAVTHPRSLCWRSLFGCSCCWCPPLRHAPAPGAGRNQTAHGMGCTPLQHGWDNTRCVFSLVCAKSRKPGITDQPPAHANCKGRGAPGSAGSSWRGESGCLGLQEAKLWLCCCRRLSTALAAHRSVPGCQRQRRVASPQRPNSPAGHASSAVAVGCHSASWTWKNLPYQARTQQMRLQDAALAGRGCGACRLAAPALGCVT